jgi:hypothetical protein
VDVAAQKSEVLRLLLGGETGGILVAPAVVLGGEAIDDSLYLLFVLVLFISC